MAALSYEGSENYIFVSYAHKDSDKVLHILEKLVDAGYRIWYDDGIAPGSEWPENIASHLDGCAVFMAFVSNQSIDSANCRREVTFALSREKPFLGILLEPTRMSLGMEMQLSAHQCILRYNYRRESEFIDKIFSCPDIACCKIQPEPEPEEIPEPDRIIVEDAPEQILVYREPEPAPEPVPAAKPKTPPKPKKAPKPKKEKKPLSKKKKLALGILGGLMALVVLLVLLFTVILPIRVTPDKKVGRNETYLSLQNQLITADTVEKINKLKKLQNLSIRSCGIEEGALDGMDLPVLSSFTMESTPGEDFSFLNRSPELVTLRLVACDVTDENISLENAPKLRFVTVRENPDFTDLNRLNVRILRELDISATGVTDISALSQAEELSHIVAADNGITSIDVLADLEELRVIDFSRCGITKVTEPFMSLSVKEIYMTCNDLEDISGFSNFTVLQMAVLGNNQLTDISLLEKSAQTLQWVSLEGNPLNFAQIRFLEGCTALTYLNLNDIPLPDLELAVNLTQLQTLSVSRCGLMELPDLSGLKQMKKLMLDGNSLTSLAGLPPLWENGNTLLDISGNQITGISELPTGVYTKLCLQNNPITFRSDDFAGKEGSNLYVDYHESLLDCRGFDGYLKIFVRDCPADQQLAMEDVLGFRGEFVNTAQMLEALLEDGREYPQ